MKFSINLIMQHVAICVACTMSACTAKTTPDSAVQSENTSGGDTSTGSTGGGSTGDTGSTGGASTGDTGSTGGASTGDTGSTGGASTGDTGSTGGASTGDTGSTGGGTTGSSGSTGGGTTGSTGGGGASFSITPIWPSDLDTCHTASFSVSADNAVGSVTYTWDFGDGTDTSTGASKTHRFLRPGTHTVTITAVDSDLNVDSDTHDMTITALDQDTLLRFELEVHAPDDLNYIRSVTIDAKAIGLPNPVRLFDDGIAGTDDTARDDIYTNQVRVKNCSNIDNYLEQSITATAQDASGVSHDLSLVPSLYVVP